MSAGVTARSTLTAVGGDRVRALQHALYRAAKADPDRRFHALFDKVHRRDVLDRAWEDVRRNRGAAGIDRVSLVDAEEYGVSRLLGELAAELREKRYRPAGHRLHRQPASARRLKTQPRSRRRPRRADSDQPAPHHRQRNPGAGPVPGRSPRACPPGRTVRARDEPGFRLDPGVLAAGSAGFVTGPAPRPAGKPAAWPAVGFPAAGERPAGRGSAPRLRGRRIPREGPANIIETRTDSYRLAQTGAIAAQAAA